MNGEADPVGLEPPRVDGFVMRPYLFNGVVLLLPPMLWNVIFYGFLPDAFTYENFTRNIPSVVLTLENVFRIATCAFAASS